MTAFLLSTVVAAVGAAQFEAKVEQAREKAITFLKKQQKPDGSWEGGVVGLIADMDGGATALATLGLLEAGVPADDKAIVKAIEYLAKLEPKKTYVVSLQTRVLVLADAKKHKEQIQKNVDWLLKNAVRSGDKLEGWSYPANNISDGSNTHYAVMALHAATEAGAKVDKKVWEEVRDMYARTQRKDGWTYYSGRLGEGRSTMSMTGAGVIGLTISAKYDPNVKKPDELAEKSLPLLFPFGADNIKSKFYGLMVLAELGRLRGETTFKFTERNIEKTWAWYKEEAEKLVKLQNAEGAFAAESRSIDGHPVLTTAFALYFLGPPKR